MGAPAEEEGMWAAVARLKGRSTLWLTVDASPRHRPGPNSAAVKLGPGLRRGDEVRARSSLQQFINCIWPLRRRAS